MTLAPMMEGAPSHPPRRVPGRAGGGGRGGHAKEDGAMERIREQRKVRILRIAPGPALPLDPRDPEVVRIKAMRRHPSYVAKQRGTR